MELKTYGSYRGIQLADADMGGPIDLILGTYNQSDFLITEPTRLSRDQHVTVSPTILGWTITAPTSGQDTITMYSVECKTTHWTNC